MEERDGVMREKEGDRALGTGGRAGGGGERRDAARATESWPLIPFLACGAETASSPAGPGRPLLSAVGAETASSSPSSAGLPSGRRRPRAPPPPAASAGRAGDRGRAGTGGRQEAPSAVGLKSHRAGDGVITSRGRRLHRGAGDPRGPQGRGTPREGQGAPAAPRTPRPTRPSRRTLFPRCAQPLRPYVLLAQRPYMNDPRGHRLDVSRRRRGERESPERRGGRRATFARPGRGG